VHDSATSQTVAAGLQTTEEETKESEGHAEEDPEQVSAKSQTPVEALQILPLEKVQVDEQQAPPSHCSDPSTTPFPQTEAGGAGAGGGWTTIG
jgi:hypothetical protein